MAECAWGGPFWSKKCPQNPFPKIKRNLVVRMCIGRKVAELEMFTLLTVIITRFKVIIIIIVVISYHQKLSLVGVR